MELLKERQKKLLNLMKDKNVKAVILSPSVNLTYMSGFSTFPGERFLVSLFINTGEIIFIVPKLYEQEVREHARFDRIIAWDDSQNPDEIFGGIVEQYGLEDCNVYIEDTMWFLAFEKIMKAMINVRYKPASEIIGELRIIKTESELNTLRKSSELADTALHNTVSKIKAGMTELQVKDILEQEMRKAGLSAPSFETIIGSGTNSALPHYTAGERIINEGDAVVIDFGGLYSGYCSDMTRTFIVGKSNEEFEKIYNIVKQAQENAINTVKSGVKASEVDAAARSYIEEMGYGKYFVHRTGHGIGMEVHETPYISNINNTVLMPGMAFSIEPGIYIPGEFGVRIEDLVIVTSNGVEVINKYSKEVSVL